MSVNGSIIVGHYDNCPKNNLWARNSFVGKGVGEFFPHKPPDVIIYQHIPTKLQLQKIANYASATRSLWLKNCRLQLYMWGCVNVALKYFWREFKGSIISWNLWFKLCAVQRARWAAAPTHLFNSNHVKKKKKIQFKFTVSQNATDLCRAIRSTYTYRVQHHTFSPHFNPLFGYKYTLFCPLHLGRMEMLCLCKKQG